MTDPLPQAVDRRAAVRIEQFMTTQQLKNAVRVLDPSAPGEAEAYQKAKEELERRYDT